jgi:hypothetical protein
LPHAAAEQACRRTRESHLGTACKIRILANVKSEIPARVLGLPARSDGENSRLQLSSPKPGDGARDTLATLAFIRIKTPSKSPVPLAPKTASL